MTKRLAYIVLIITLLSTPFTAHADVVMGNEFYFNHKSKTLDLEQNRFIVNTPNGYVIPRQEPGQSKVRTIFPGMAEEEEIPKFQNGTELMISRVYLHNGEYWGLMQSGHTHMYPGWIPMKHLLEVYTPVVFEAEHKIEFYTYLGDFDAVSKALQVVIWPWPGSDREKTIRRDMEPLTSGSLRFSYKDSDGREWGKLTTFGWVCLTDPGNIDILPFHPEPPPAKWVVPETFPSETPKNYIAVLLLLLTGVAAAILILNPKHKS